MGEARTQHFVMQYLQHKNNLVVRAPHLYLAFTWNDCGFIVSKYIYRQECDNSDDALIVTAVMALITIPSPNLKPGPVRGGLIEHPFFYNRTSSIQYKSIEDLEDHVNGVSVLFCKGVSALECQTGGWVGRSAAGRKKKFWNPL